MPSLVNDKDLATGASDKGVANTSLGVAENEDENIYIDKKTKIVYFKGKNFKKGERVSWPDFPPINQPVLWIPDLGDNAPPFFYDIDQTSNIPFDFLVRETPVEYDEPYNFICKLDKRGEEIQLLGKTEYAFKFAGQYIVPKHLKSLCGRQYVNDEIIAGLV